MDFFWGYKYYTGLIRKQGVKCKEQLIFYQSWVNSFLA